MSEKNPFCKLGILEYRRVGQTKSEIFLEKSNRFFYQNYNKIVKFSYCKNGQSSDWGSYC